MHPLVRRYVLCDAHAGPPFPRGPDRPRCKAAAAVRADVEQFRVDAVRAEGAFVGADARVGRIRRQVLVAIFAIGTELQGHADLLRAEASADDRKAARKSEGRISLRSE